MLNVVAPVQQHFSLKVKYCVSILLMKECSSQVDKFNFQKSIRKMIVFFYLFDQIAEKAASIFTAREPETMEVKQMLQNLLIFITCFKIHTRSRKFSATLIFYTDRLVEKFGLANKNALKISMA